MKSSRRITMGLKNLSPRASRLAMGAGAALAVAGAVAVALKVSAHRKAKRAQSLVRAELREDHDAEARMDSEGAAMQPVSLQARGPEVERPRQAGADATSTATGRAG